MPPARPGRPLLPGFLLRPAHLSWVLCLALLTATAACRDTSRRERPVPGAARIDAGFTYESGQPALDRLQAPMRETLERNRRTFAGTLGPVSGFGAGALYPQIWLRDSATLIQLSRYLYPAEYLTSWIEEHLAHQRDDGAVFDWIAEGRAGRFRGNAPRVQQIEAGGAVLSADRNSAVTDQEASVVLSAAQVFAITGDRAWLSRSVNGRPLLARLAAALEHVASRSTDPATGLVTAAFTADWGDVAPVYADQRAIYRDEATPVVAGLYASAMFSGAAEALSDLYRASGDGRAAGAWHLRARAMATAIDRALWQDDSGYYRIHLPVRTVPGWRFPDGEPFALGGNAIALLHGVADDTKVSRVIAAAAARQARYGMPTISGVLLPPFPARTFRHPLLREEYRYQNGGQWDWWGGRLLLAAFERGHAEFARAELARVAEQAISAGGLYEWTTREGEGRGSATYAGTAGMIAATVLRGLYGIDLRRDRLDVHVRLGSESGSVRVAEPATGTTVEYRYRVDAGASQASLEYMASMGGTGTLTVRLPPGFTDAAARLDGGDVPLDIVHVGRDTYARLSTDWRAHRLALMFR